jgi:hypothetical protein
MSYYGKIYKQLGDWFKENPSSLIPKDGMACSNEQIEPYRKFFDTESTIDMDCFNLEGEVNEALSETIYEEIPCRHTDLPLIVAIQAGVRGVQLTEIARHHGTTVSTLIETLEAMELNEYTLYDASGVDLPLSEVYVECVKAVSEAFPEQYSRELRNGKSHDNLYVASLHTENPEFWPVSRIALHMKNIAQGLVSETPEDVVSECNFNASITTDDFLPKDATGIRYDLFLERSGMLLPEVATKRVGDFMLWEDMLDVAKKSELDGVANLLSYCIHDAPEHLRPAIFKGLSGLSLQTSPYDRYWIFNFFKNSVAGTWLEPISKNPNFILSVLGHEYLDTLYMAFFPESSSTSKPDYAEASGILQICLEALMHVPPDEMGASHFQTWLVGRLNISAQVFSKDFKPEPVLVHLLNGFESFSLPAEGGPVRDIRLDEAATRTCIYVAKVLAKRFELDYQAFSGLSSKCVRLLAEAGLDKRRLPRMSSKDRGHVVSQELGL